MFTLNQKVFVKTVKNEIVNWQAGTITKVISLVTYLVNVNDRTRFVHSDHLRLNQSAGEDTDEDILVRFPRELYSSPTQPSPPRTPKCPIQHKSPGHVQDLPQQHRPNQEEFQGNEVLLRCSQRDQREPRRINM